MIRKQLRPAIVLTLVLCVVTGFVYPGIVTGLAQLLFPQQANGSLVTVNGQRGGKRAHRPAVHAGLVLPPAPVRGGRADTTVPSSGGHQQGADGSPTRRHADRRRRSDRRGALGWRGEGCRSRPTWPRARPPDSIRTSRRPTLRCRWRASRARAVPTAPRARAGGSARGRAPVRLLRRAARERAAAEHRARLGLCALRSARARDHERTLMTARLMPAFALAIVALRGTPARRAGREPTRPSP